jgi:5-formyltetrahydrofolate cyclo-ligase
MTDRTAPSSAADDKAERRAAMRTLRRSLPDRERRSEVLWQHLVTLPAVAAADRMLVFTSLPGEPDTTTLFVWGAATGRLVAVPEDDVDPTWPDVVVVPGLAFTASGDRLGQGGGWYDRFLAEVRGVCSTIGVCFAEQIVDVLPVEPHDVRLHHVVTDQGVLR